MRDSLEMLILDVLSDGRARYVTSVRVAFECDVGVLEAMAAAGLVRFPDVTQGGKTVCITPRGLDVFARERRKK